MPTEEKINDNLRELRKEQWFQQMFSENTEQFLENKEIRLTVGLAKTEKIKNNEKNAKDLQEVLTILLNKKKKSK